jgi:hypothetical protein
VLAPLPNSICARCAGADDFSADYNSAFLDFGNWLTAATVVSGFALPITLAHAGIIREMACIMSSAGGLLVYGTSELASKAGRDAAGNRMGEMGRCACATVQLPRWSQKEYDAPLSQPAAIRGRASSAHQAVSALGRASTDAPCLSPPAVMTYAGFFNEGDDVF